MKNPIQSRTIQATAFISLTLSHLALGQITNTYEWIHELPTPPPTPVVFGTWDNGENWALGSAAGTTGVAPSLLEDAARITNGETASIADSSNDVKVGMIFVAGAGGSFLSVDADVTVSARQIRIGSNQVGTVLLNTGEMRLVNQESEAVLSPELVIGVEGGGQGTLTQTGGILDTSAVNVGNGHPDTRIGAFGADGTYDLQGGSAHLYNLRVGFANVNSTGTINHSAGVLTHDGELALGWADAEGIYNLSGTGSMTSTNRIRVGATAGTHGTLNQSGGTAEIIGGRLELGTENGAHGTYNMSGGTMLVHDDIFVGAFDDTVPKGTTGFYTQTGGNVTCNRLLVGFAPGTSGTVKLNGGTLKAQSAFVRSDQPGGTGTISFDGGTIIANGGGDFIHHFPDVTLNSGGGTVDSNGQGINIVPPVIGVGGLTKKGKGFVNLTALSDYSGNTVIQEGGLFLNVPGGLSPNSDLIIGSATPVEGEEFPRIELRYTGMDTVSHLIVNGVSLAPGIYGSADAPGEHLLSDHILGTGLLKVEPATVLPGYDTWASDPANGLTAGERASDFDADGDGFNNLLEYFLGGKPKIPSTTIAPVLSLAGSDLKITFNRSTDSAADTTAVVQWTTDLQNWLPANQIVVTGTGTITETIPSSNAVNGKLFARLKVAKP